AEVPVPDIARHLPGQLLEAPLLKLLEDQHSEDNLGRRAVATSAAALWPPLRELAEDLIDQLVLIEELVDPAEPRVEEVFWFGRNSEQHHPRERELRVSASSHPITGSRRSDDCARSASVASRRGSVIAYLA